MRARAPGLTFLAGLGLRDHEYRVAKVQKGNATRRLRWTT